MRLWFTVQIFILVQIYCSEIDRYRVCLTQSINWSTIIWTALHSPLTKLCWKSITLSQNWCFRWNNYFLNNSHKQLICRAFLVHKDNGYILTKLILFILLYNHWKFLATVCTWINRREKTSYQNEVRQNTAGMCIPSMENCKPTSENAYDGKHSDQNKGARKTPNLRENYAGFILCLCNADGSFFPVLLMTVRVQWKISRIIYSHLGWSFPLTRVVPFVECSV